MNKAQKQFTRTFLLAVASVFVWAIGWEYFPKTRAWLTVAVVLINSPAILRDYQNLGNSNSRYDPGRFVGLSSRKPWVLWVMSLYGFAAAVFFVLAVTSRLDVSGINLPILLVMLAPLVIPATVVYYEGLEDD